jgi:uncharacterized membrane protein YoaK (UPF0700 family)
VPLRSQHWSRRYSVVLLLESAALVGAGLLLSHQVTAGLYLACIACGLQNAMASTLSGAVIRTTHVSGMFTDLGAYIAHALRGAPVDALRARVCILVISGFLCGGVAGAAAFASLSALALLVPAGLVATAAVLGNLLSDRRSGLYPDSQNCESEAAAASSP